MPVEALYLYGSNGTLDDIVTDPELLGMDPKNIARLMRNEQAVLFGFEEEASPPPPRFKNLREAAKHFFEMEEDAEGYVVIRNVPIFKAHSSESRKYNADEAFLDRMVRNHYGMLQATKEVFGTSRFAWLPKVHFGHTPTDPNLPEQKCVGFVREIFRVENFLLGDISGLDKSSVDALVSGTYPDRSPEVDVARARLLSVAFLGHRAPHFALPQMRNDVLAKRYAELNVERHSFTASEFEDKTMLTDEQVGKFLLKCSIHSKLMETYTKAKQDEIDRYMDTNGTVPLGPQLEQLVRNVIAHLLQNKVNTTMMAECGLDASEFLDLESKKHHTVLAGEGSPPPDKTKAGGGTTGMGGGETVPIDHNGYPAGGDSKTISAQGSVVANALDDSVKVIRHAMSQLPTEERTPVSKAVEDVLRVTESFGEMLSQHQAAIKNLTKHNQELQKSRQETYLRAELEKIRREGFISVGDEHSVDRHMKTLMRLDADGQTEYLNNLRQYPRNDNTIRHTKVTRDQAIEPSGGTSDVVSVVRNSFKDRTVRHAAEQLGIDEKVGVLAEMWSRISEE